jgi:hypothetical protein
MLGKSLNRDLLTCGDDAAAEVPWGAKADSFVRPDAPSARGPASCLDRSLNGNQDAAAVVERCVPRPGDVPNVSLGVAPGEATAPERFFRLGNYLDAFDPLQRLEHGLTFREAFEVDAECEAPEAASDQASPERR